jgi:hypothetical protein
VIELDNFPSFFRTFLFGDHFLPPISHNLVYNSLIHYGIFLSLVTSFFLISCLIVLYNPMLRFPAAKLSLSIVITLVIFQLPEPTHPLYALLLSYVSACSNLVQNSFSKFTTP